MTDSGEHRFVQALRRLEDEGDPEPLVELFAEDSFCENLTGTGRQDGREGARRFWSEDRALFEEIRSEFHNIVDQDGRVMLEWTRQGSAHDGQEVRYDGVSVIELSDGHITRFKAYYDPKRVGRQAA